MVAALAVTVVGCSRGDHGVAAPAPKDRRKRRHEPRRGRLRQSILRPTICRAALSSSRPSRHLREARRRREHQLRRPRADRRSLRVLVRVCVGRGGALQDLAVDVARRSLSDERAGGTADVSPVGAVAAGRALGGAGAVFIRTAPLRWVTWRGSSSNPRARARSISTRAPRSSSRPTRAGPSVKRGSWPWATSLISDATIYPRAYAKLVRARELTAESGRIDYEAELAKAALRAGYVDKAEQHARALLRHVDEAPPSMWTGNYLYDAHAALGRVALRRRDVAAAKKYLLAAANTPGSPTLDSFGPDMTLASELLEQGERDVVLDYFDLVERFDVDDVHGDLDVWREQNPQRSEATAPALTPASRRSGAAGARVVVRAGGSCTPRCRRPSGRLPRW